MKRVMIIALTMMLSGIALAAAEKPSPQKYQSLFLASLIDGWCQAKQQTGQTTETDKNQCDYVRTGLANKCFERGACPKYEDWLKTGSQNRNGATIAESLSIQSRVIVHPSLPVDGSLMHGLTLTAAGDAFPVLVKVQDIEQPFVGQAYLQSGRAVVRIVDYGTVAVDGYVVSPADRKSGLPVKCLRTRDIGASKECIVGDIAEGTKIKVIFPKGVDIAQWKKSGE